MTPSPTVMSHSQPDMTDMDFELSDLPNSSSADEDAGSPPHSPQQTPVESCLRQKKSVRIKPPKKELKISGKEYITLWKSLKYFLQFLF